MIVPERIRYEPRQNCLVENRRMVGKESTEDVLCGHLELIGELGAVPRTGVYDGEPATSSR
jgi:hypothetical protein